MPLTWPMDDQPAVEAGTLYLVATPIGNRADITLRALAVLEQADLVAAEDTRTSGRLLAGYGIERPLVAYHEHNETRQAARLLQALDGGRSVALISDAGTPLVSDPGYRLVKAAVASNIPVVPVPGPSALTAALSASGLPTDAFVFAGFPARKPGKRRQQLESFARDRRTVVFFESPRRLMGLLEDLHQCLGNRHVVVARELTKLHEEFIRGPVTLVIRQLQQRPAIKGEVTLLVAGADKTNAAVDRQHLDQALAKALEETGGSVSGAASLVAGQLGVHRRQAYRRALEIKKARGTG